MRRLRAAFPTPPARNRSTKTTPATSWRPPVIPACWGATTRCLARPTSPADRTAPSRAGSISKAAPHPRKPDSSAAKSNPSHFSPSNIRQNWIAKHQLALDLARQAWSARHPGSTPASLDAGDAVTASGGGSAPSVRGGQRSVAQASARPPLDPTAAVAAVAAPGLPDSGGDSHPGRHRGRHQPGRGRRPRSGGVGRRGFSYDYLTDAFAAGHLVSGDRSIYQGFYASHRSEIVKACDGALADQAPLAAVIAPFLDKLAGNLLLKVVHDYYNNARSAGQKRARPGVDHVRRRASRRPSGNHRYGLAGIKSFTRRG